MTDALAVLALLVSGTMVGVELAVAVVLHPVVDRLPADTGLTGRVDGARVMGRLMPFWYAASTLLSSACAYVHRADPLAWTAPAALACFVAGIVVSVAVLVPINNRARTWTAENAPPDWRAQLDRWDHIHLVRLVVVTAGFTLLAVALT